MTEDLDPYESAIDVINVRLQILASDLTEHGASTPAEIEAEIVELRADKSEMQRHWRIKDQPVAAGEPVLCRACGEPRNCSTARRLFIKYLNNDRP